AFLLRLRARTQAVLNLMANPEVSAVPNYRRMMAAWLGRLTYLDDRPVFDGERLATEACFIFDKLIHLSTDTACLAAERAERDEERANQERNFQAMKALQERGRRRREEAGLPEYGVELSGRLLELRDEMLAKVDGAGGVGDEGVQEEWKKREACADVGDDEEEDEDGDATKDEDHDNDDDDEGGVEEVSGDEDVGQEGSSSRLDSVEAQEGVVVPTERTAAVSDGGGMGGSENVKAGDVPALEMWATARRDAVGGSATAVVAVADTAAIGAAGDGNDDGAEGPMAAAVAAMEIKEGAKVGAPAVKYDEEVEDVGEAKPWQVKWGGSISGGGIGGAVAADEKPENAAGGGEATVRVSVAAEAASSVRAVRGGETVDDAEVDADAEVEVDGGQGEVRAGGRLRRASGRDATGKWTAAAA
ncbi:hypothetical protein HK405_006986, partial [Cladochytrium tenue]